MINYPISAPQANCPRQHAKLYGRLEIRVFSGTQKTPATLQETCATLHETRAKLQETRGTLHETPATLQITHGVVSGSLYRRTHRLSRLAWSWVGGRLAPFNIHRMNRVLKLSQWLCHDDSTINVVLVLLLSASLYFSKRGAY